MVTLGEIYWIDSQNAKSDISHPYVIIDVTESRITLCALTTNMKKVSIQGNILLHDGEANLPKQSIVEVNKTITLTQSDLGEYIGTLSDKRIQQIQAGIRFVERSFYPKPKSVET